MQIDEGIFTGKFLSQSWLIYYHITIKIQEHIVYTSIRISRAYVHILNTYIKNHTHSLAQWTSACYCWQTFALEAGAIVYPLAVSTEAQFGDG